MKIKGFKMEISIDEIKDEKYDETLSGSSVSVTIEETEVSTKELKEIIVEGLDDITTSDDAAEKTETPDDRFDSIGKVIPSKMRTLYEELFGDAPYIIYQEKDRLVVTIGSDEITREDQIDDNDALNKFKDMVKELYGYNCDTDMDDVGVKIIPAPYLQSVKKFESICEREYKRGQIRSSYHKNHVYNTVL